MDVIAIKSAYKVQIRHFVNVSCLKVKMTVPVNLRNALITVVTAMENVFCFQAPKKSLVFVKYLMLDCFVINHVVVQELKLKFWQTKILASMVEYVFLRVKAGIRINVTVKRDSMEIIVRK